MDAITRIYSVIFIVFETEFIENLTKEGFFDGLKEVGFNLTMKRIQQPFILRYYLPCVAIVIVTQISFYIPPDAIPGRIGLLITLFLTLMNLLIGEQVNLFRIHYPKYILIVTEIINNYDMY